MRKNFNVWYTEENGCSNHIILEAENACDVIKYMASRYERLKTMKIAERTEGCYSVPTMGR